MTQSIGLDAIYTTVNIFEKVTGRQRQAIAELLQGCNFEELTSLGQVKEERVPGLAAVEQHPKLMILGKPGAGKTTFLKWIATQCNNGQSRAAVVPAFVTLKAFAEAKGQPDLLTYLSGQWADCGVKDTQTAVTLLSEGRVLLLLDGLDEVRDSDHDRVLQEIRDFSTRFRTCQFVMTCRIAAREYTFEQFTEVEVADFDDKQIADFVDKWFAAKQDPMKIERFLEKLRGNARIRELATNPLLLTLLCWVFQESADFPTNRSELYREGLDVLLKKWDAKRNIERDALHQRSEIYQSLSVQRKEDLLSQVAFITFERGDLFFRQQAAEHYIAEFIRNLPGISDDPASLELDSETILKSIEAQHGLLVERARNIYSFSHLTFHEYFTARKIAYSSPSQAVKALQGLVIHTTEKRWQEVFLLTVGMLREADDLLFMMKTQIDELLVHDEELQNFLGWVEKKSRSLAEKVPYKMSAVRAFYFDIAREKIRELDIALDVYQVRTLARQIDPEIRYGNSDIFSLSLDLELSRIVECIRALDIAQNQHMGEIDSLSDIDIHRSFRRLLDIDNPIGVQLIYGSELWHLLEQLRDEVPQLTIDSFQNNVVSHLKEWWQANGRSWTKKLREVLINDRNIGHDWQLSVPQEELLGKYYDANSLLINCLNSNGYVTRSVREEIEATLLLPQSLLPSAQT